jgi:hypothetical protein
MMADAQTVTGLDFVFVNTKRPSPEHAVMVREGEELPADLRPGELERLAGIGAFEPHPREGRERRLAAAQAAAGPGMPIASIDVAGVVEVLDDPAPAADVTGTAPITE